MNIRVRVRALAKAVKQDTAYVARTTRVTLLTPDIIDAIMAGHCPPTLTLKRLSRTFPMRWDEQRRVFRNYNISNIGISY